MDDLPVQRNLEPMPQDELEHLQSRVQWRSSGRVRSFRLLIQGHGLVLQGHAPTYYAKQLAQHAIMEATHMPILANEIEVR